MVQGLDHDTAALHQEQWVFLHQAGEGQLSIIIPPSIFIIPQMPSNKMVSVQRKTTAAGVKQGKNNLFKTIEIQVKPIAIEERG